MTIVSNREELKEFCLRKLGGGVVNINISNDQAEDRVDDALQYFFEWHIDGSEKMYMKYKPTTTSLTFTTPLSANSFQKGDLITGSSGVISTVHKQDADNLSIQVWQTGSISDSDAMFSVGETITGPHGTGVLSAVIPGDLDKKWIPVDDHILMVLGVFPVSAVLPSNFLFDPVYYSMFDLLFNFNGLDLISYESMKTRINFINELLIGQKPVQFRRYTNKLKILMDWKKSINPDMWLIVDCYRRLDPADYPSIYNDFFLKEYLTALLKIQWGTNLSKFNGIQMMNGVTLDGPRILQEGLDAKKDLEEQMKSGRWSEPLGFSIG